MRPTPSPRRALWPRLAAAIIMIASVLATAGPALAGWGAGASGAARARSTDVPLPAAPDARLAARTVTLSWPEATLPDGTPVDGYRVTRRVDGGAAVELPACAGTTRACTDPSVPVGTLTYAVTAAVGPWTRTGPATPVTVAAPVLTLTNRVGAVPATLTGSVDGAVPGASLSARLDDPVAGPALAISPAVVGPGAATAVSVVLPAGTTLGSHTVHVRAGADALSAPVTYAADASPSALVWVANRDGRARTGDSLRVGFTQPLSTASLSPSDPDGDVNVVVSLLDGAGTNGDDLLRVSGLAGATVAFGDIDLGSAGFVVNDITFGTTEQPSTLRWNPTDRTLTLTLGRESSSSAKTVAGAVTATFRPSAGLRTSTGGSVTGSAVAVAVAF